jgi:hypothetical protein
MAYVGKILNNQMRIARIQVAEPGRGFYLADKGKGLFIKNGGFYLYNNPSYHYYWVDSNPLLVSPNAVVVTAYGPNSASAFISRVQTDGQTNIGVAFFGAGSTWVKPDGIEAAIGNYQVLVCDPKPVNPCSKCFMYQ